MKDSLWSRIVTIAIMLPILTTASAQVYINEVMASNSNSITDPDFGENADWVELFNADTVDVDLSGWQLTDNLKKPSKYVFPDGTLLPAGGFLLVWCDDRATGLHTPFKLSADGEEIGLFGANGEMKDSLRFGPQFTNVSYGRLEDDRSATSGDACPDNKAQLRFFMEPTPGMANSTVGYTGQASQPDIITQGGLFDGPVTVAITNDLGGVLHYTTDGSEPTSASPVYTSPLTFDRTTVLRARILEEGKMPGRVMTMSYFINEETQRHHLPVVSLVSNPENFWDKETGIYVQDFKPDWEKAANIELFENNGSDRSAFNEAVGVKINGLYAWQLPQKMLGIYFKKRYGEGKLSYNLFHDSPRTTFDDFSLRASGSDWSYTLFRDGLLQQASRKTGMNLDLMAFRPSVVYLNGEFLGIHNIREKVDEDYVVSNFGIEAGTFDMVEGADYAECGNLDAWNELMLLWSRDMTVQSNFDALADIFDMENYTDYMAAELFSQNTSLSHNTMAWKPRTGGKWRWILMDADRGFFSYGSDVFSTFVGKNYWPLKYIIKNNGYKDYFFRRVADHLFVTYNPEEIQRQISQHASDIEPVMEKHLARWEGTTSSYGNAIPSMQYWYNQVNRMRDFCYGRPIVLLSDMAANYGVGSPAMLMLSASQTGAATFSFNGLPLTQTTWSGHYPTQMPIRLKAESRDGYQFLGWKRNSIDTLLTKSETWRYLDNGSNQGEAWHEPAFDDAPWKTGGAPLGYGTGGLMTTKVGYGPSSSNKYITTYFRKTFTIEANPSSFLRVKLNLLREDGAVVWLNGQRIVVSNIYEPINYRSTAKYACGGLAETSFLTFDVDPMLLCQGENVIAVEVHQAAASSTDMSFNAELIAEVGSIDASLFSTSETVDFTLDAPMSLTAMYEKSGLNALPDTIHQDTTLMADEYFATADVVVATGAHLTIMPGTTIRFSSNASLIVNGTLTADGTEAQPILFTRSVCVDSATTTQDEHWGAICFINSRGASSISHATIEGAWQGPRLYNCVAAISAFRCEKLRLDHVTIVDVESNPIAARYSDIALTNSRLHSKVTGDLINVKYGRALVEHCTFVGNDQVDTDAIDYDGIEGGIIRDVVAHHFLGANSDAVDIGEHAKGVVIDSLMAYNITDKGVSVGQRSSVTITNSTFIQTNMGVAVKDSCTAIVDHCTFYAVVNPIACYEKVVGRAGGNASVSRSILSNSYGETVLCDERSKVVVSNSISDNDILPDEGGNVGGNPLFTSAATFDLTTPDDDFGSTYLPSRPDIEPVICELCYNPHGANGETEYLCLYNPDEEPLSLAGYCFNDGIDHLFPEDAVIPAKGRYYLAANPSALTEIIDEWPVSQWASGQLANEGETIRLCNPAGIIVDQLTYAVVAPWPVIPDNPSHENATSVLRLKNLTADNHNGAEWVVADYPTGIEAVVGRQDETAGGRAYDLNGRSVPQSHHGIIIVHGKKVFVR